nr:radical SAM protein [Deltaproteobacteria bacterium]
FEQEVQGLRNALADGRPIVNIDVCVNRGNVRDLPQLMETFTGIGVREFDLLHVIPFGRAYTEGKETLFYDLEQMRPYLLEAFAYARKPDMHVWLNRFPPQHLEGYEDLIQDPYKLGDEVRGRKEEYALLLREGEPLDCRSPDRCRHCYLEPLCDTLDDVRQVVASAEFSRVRVDAHAQAPVVYGGDPASKKRSDSRNQVQAEAAAGMVEQPGEGVRHLRLWKPKRPVYRPLPALVEAAGVDTVWVVANELGAARDAVAPLPGAAALELQLADYTGLGDAIDERGQVFGRTLQACRVTTVAQAEALLALPGTFEVRLELSVEVEPWLRQLAEAPARLAVVQPTHDRLTISAERDVDLPALMPVLPAELPVEGVPACVLGRSPRTPPVTLDAAMLDDDGALEIFRFARRYIHDRFFTKSLRCKTCIHDASCPGLHINYVRAHGYDAMQPVTGDDG